jgi:hypothetical protein
MPPPEKLLTKLTKKNDVRRCRTHALWVDARDTPADIDGDRLIAAGRARPGDTFVCVRWKRPGET